MFLTKSQQQRFWREWSAVVKHQGWQQTWTRLQIEQQRHELLQRAGFASLREVDRTAGFDRVLAELGLLQDNVARTIEHQNPDPGKRRNLLWLIRKHSAALGGEPYICALARDRFKVTAGLTTIEQLTTDQLHQLMITLNARSHTKQAAVNASLTSEETFQDDVAFAPGDPPAEDAWTDQEASEPALATVVDDNPDPF